MKLYKADHNKKKITEIDCVSIDRYNYTVKDEYELGKTITYSQTGAFSQCFESEKEAKFYLNKHLQSRIEYLQSRLV